MTLDAYRQIAIRFVDIPLKQAVELSSQLNIYGYDTYVIACAINQQAALLSLDGGLVTKAKSLGLEILEVTSQ